MKLTDATIKALACPEGKKDALFFDDTLKGFGIRVMPDRADGRPRKVFLLQYRVGQKVRREPIGDWGSELTAGQARRKAEALRGAVRDRRDPVAERKAASTARAEIEAAAKKAAIADAFTFEKLIEAWEARSLINRRASYRKEAVNRVRQGFKSLLERPASKVTRGDAAKAIEVIAEKRGPIAANRAMAYARACYGWANKANLLEENPFAGLAAPGRERARDRVLTEGEIAGIWTISGRLAPVQQAFLRFLLLTLQRRDEVAGAMWSEFSSDLETWTIPKERAKNGRAHLVHLAPAARTVLGTVTRRQGNTLVFAVPGRKLNELRKLSAYSFIKRDIDVGLADAEAELAKEHDREPVPVPPWTLHDFRRTGVTFLAGAGIPPHVCDRLLNHVSGAIQGVAAVYQRAEFLAERKAALEAWAAWVSRPTS